MEHMVTLTIIRTGAKIFRSTLELRSERCAIFGSDSAGPDSDDELGREEAVFCQEENAVVERAIRALRALLAVEPTGSKQRKRAL